jgi:hypothetical protein
MKHVFTAARILLGLIFLVFSLNYWLSNSFSVKVGLDDVVGCGG